MKVLILCALVVAASAMKKFNLDEDCGVELASNQGKGLMGAFKPRCTNDGKYEAVQCHGSMCFCMSENGKKISDYQDHIANIGDQDCNCARDEYEFRLTGRVGLSFNCKDNGNYDDIQCMGVVCSCVDRQGNFMANSEKVNIWEQDKLQC